jgi:peptidoglycan/LPS O-acetylase OafA/YrhL
MWSVATEWQIYFLFLALLLPVWRRFGNIAVALVGFVVGIALSEVSHKAFADACPWFIGCFAIGMVAADISFSRRASIKRLHDKTLWGVVTTCLAATIIVIYVFITRLAVYGILMDILVSICSASLIIYCAKEAHNSVYQSGTVSIPHKRPLITRCLESRGVVELGAFSYSLYLVHYPVLGALHLFLRDRHCSPNICFLWLLVLGLPLSLVTAYGFHLLFEKPFMNSVPIKKLTVSQESVATPP